MQLKELSILLVAVIALFLTQMTFARTYGQRICKYTGLSCLHVKRGQSWESLWPDDHDRGIVMRLNRMNTQLYPGMIIAVPKHLAEADIMQFAPFVQKIKSPGEKIIVVDPAESAWAAYDAEGNLVRWGPASSGQAWCHDVDAPCQTHEGRFRIFSLGSSDCISHKFPLPDGGAPMPYCMYFNNGQALHGEPNGLPGYNASHGCVRLYVNDAEWLRYDFVEGPNQANQFRGTAVVVKLNYSASTHFSNT